MGIFSFSDLIIGITLLLNAVALLAYKPKHVAFKTTSSQAELVPLTSTNVDVEGLDSEPNGDTAGTEQNLDIKEVSVNERLLKVIVGIRKLSCCIVLWNIFFSILMVFVFRG